MTEHGRPEYAETTVAEVMTRPVRSAGPDAGFEELVRALAEHRIRVLPIVDPDGRLLGVVSEADLMPVVEHRNPRSWRQRWRREPNVRTERITARQLMSGPVVTVSPDASLAEAARTMRRHKLAWLAVVEPERPDGSRIAGVVTRSDLLAAYVRGDDELRAEITEALRAVLPEVELERISLDVADGVVTVTGRLTTATQAWRVVDFIRRLEGVIAVVDRLGYDVDDSAVTTMGPLY